MKVFPIALALFMSNLGFSQADPTEVDAIVQTARERVSRINDVQFRDGEFLPVIQAQNVLAEINPHDEETWSNLEWMYFNIHALDLQWLTCHRFRINNLNYSDGAYYEAKLFYLNKSYAKVPPLLEPTLKMDPPPDGNVYRFLAHSYEKMGYYEDALRVWDAYLEKFPKDAQGKNNRNKVAKALGK